MPVGETDCGLALARRSKPTSCSTCWSGWSPDRRRWPPPPLPSPKIARPGLPMPRTASISRKTNETQIELSLNLDGSGKSLLETGVGFFDHMLDLWARHGASDLAVKCLGDLHVDQHHTVEDVGICLGQAFRQALGDKKGIRRYGHMTLPMEETLVTTAVDLSGRYYFVFDPAFPSPKIGDFDSELVEDFWQAFAANVLCN